MTNTDIEDSYFREVSLRIRGAVKSGASDFTAVLKECEGADPNFVYDLYETILKEKIVDNTENSLALVDPTDTHLWLNLPAPDPARSQWWFTSNTIHSLSKRVDSIALLFDTPRVFCLGAPSIAHYLDQRGIAVDLVDVDPDVISALSSMSDKSERLVYDAANELPKELQNHAVISISDPPWYESAIRKFLYQSLMALQIGGELLLTFPPRLTRPGIDIFRTELLGDIQNAGHEILGIEHNVVAYQVPRFEQVALSKNKSFSVISWRNGDLIHIRKGKGIIQNSISLESQKIRSFSRNPRHFRVFIKETTSLDEKVPIRILENYSTNISTRALMGEDPDVWSTEKVGIQISNHNAIIAILEAWKNNKNKNDTIKEISSEYDESYSRELVERIDNALCLWSKFADPPPLRTDEDINKIKSEILTEWASKPTKREHSDPSDTYRSAFQRDRDRILWSSSLRRLSNKTQLFPSEYDDQLRQRLTHCLEVLQLASTIGASFGLDNDLIEAGALSHDLGHTPFGHAGEFALQKLLREVKLKGFNHYEHGVDIVRYLEGPYHVSNATKFYGLNLTAEVLECIFKHTYSQNEGEYSANKLLECSKHKEVIPEGYCHLEGQAVRIADKISYLISDIEDGLRLGILSADDLESCQFFHRPPLDLIGHRSDHLYERFLLQRRVMLRILMEDVLHATSKRLSFYSIHDIRSANEYIVNYSDNIYSDIDEIWNKLQVGRLHKDRRVLGANLAAARIVTELTVAFALIPNLVDNQFFMEHRRLWESAYMNFYKNECKKVRIPKELFSFLPMYTLIDGSFNESGDADVSKDADVNIEYLIMAKDYVASLSDSRARTFHRNLLAGPTNI
ncbi:MAG: deoxyguanosinetriphosphate triphosphohydrolase family protein [Armatimonadota bacterium]